ncbi:MAG: hypothetical protein HY960_04490 [Ignavibacteriae bacterium]|nr:hypothetical protein [Ignavibacteriota bacterium]
MQSGRIFFDLTGKIFNSLLLIVVLCSVALTQVSDTTQQADTSLSAKNRGSDNRVRIFAGLVSKWEPELSKIGSPFPFINCNYRLSNFLPSDSSYKSKLGFSTEIGTNYIIIPYFKIGPEFRHSGGLYIDVHAGVTTSFTQLFPIIPFYGAELGLIGNPDAKTRVEFEVGVNFSMMILPYFAVGVSF